LRNFSDKSTIGESLYNYGWGDGGAVLMPRCSSTTSVIAVSRPGADAPEPHRRGARLDRQAGQKTLICHTQRRTLSRGTPRRPHTTKARLKKLNRRASGSIAKPNCGPAWHLMLQTVSNSTAAGRLC
jgi:hypothetical protein